MSTKKWIVKFSLLRREPKYDRDGYDYFWITEEKEVMATSRKDALRKALREWNQESYKKDQYKIIPPAKGGKRTYYIYAYYGEHIIVRARSKKQLQVYVHKKYGHVVGDFFIKKLTVRRPTAEEQEEDIKPFPLSEEDPIVFCSNCKKP